MRRIMMDHTGSEGIFSGRAPQWDSFFSPTDTKRCNILECDQAIKDIIDSRRSHIRTPYVY